jgi:hypothetical protein
MLILMLILSRMLMVILILMLMVIFILMLILSLMLMLILSLMLMVIFILMLILSRMLMLILSLMLMVIFILMLILKASASASALDFSDLRLLPTLASSYVVRGASLIWPVLGCVAPSASLAPAFAPSCLRSFASVPPSWLGVLRIAAPLPCSVRLASLRPFSARCASHRGAPSLLGVPRCLPFAPSSRCFVRSLGLSAVQRFACGLMCAVAVVADAAVCW